VPVCPDGALCHPACPVVSKISAKNSVVIEPTLDELQRSLSESLAQMRQLRQTLNAENADGDLATETEKDDGEAVSWNAEMPAAIESHRTALLGGTPTASESASTGPSGEDPPADKSAETAPPPAGATAGSSEEPVPTAGGGSVRRLLRQAQQATARLAGGRDRKRRRASAHVVSAAARWTCRRRGGDQYAGWHDSM
jgi:hypothetical protein